MARRTLIAATATAAVAAAAVAAAILLGCQASHAFVVVYSPQTDCDSLLLQRKVRGLKMSLSHDPTDQPAQNMGVDAYSVEVLSDLEKVRDVYASIFATRGIPADEAQSTLEQFKQADENRVTQQHNQNGLDNTVYLVNRSKDGVALSVMRATLIRSEDKRQLPLEAHVKIPTGHRVELERAYNSPGPRAHIVANEMMMVMAQYLRSYFGGDNYTVYALTDQGRARLYERHYGFTTEHKPEMPTLVQYLCSQSGAALYDRYLGHIERAYQMAFQLSNYGRGKDEALELLNRYESQPGLKDYIPNLVARSVILAGYREYNQAVQVSRRLHSIGFAEINTDYLALWNARAKYDALEIKGNAPLAEDQLQRYLRSRPLDLTQYNERALLFLVFQIKHYFSTGQYSQAEKLLRDHRVILQIGRAKMAGQFQAIWQNYTRLSRREALLSPLSPATRIWYLSLLMDLSTHKDPFSTAALHPQVWREYVALLPGGDTRRIRFTAAAQILEEWERASRPTQMSLFGD